MKMMETHDEDSECPEGSATISPKPTPGISDSSDKDECDSVVSCTYEIFEEHEEVAEWINYLPTLCDPNSYNSRNIERAYEKMKFTLSKYKEQPHLLDPYLQQMLSDILSMVLDENLSLLVKHRAFKYLYLITNARGYKEVVKHLPHKISDLDFVLRFLEEQNPMDAETWETRYGLLLWLTIVILLPFDLSLLDSGNMATTVAERLLTVGKLYIMGLDSCLKPAALFLARLVTREDVKVVHLELIIDWLLKKITDVDSNQEWEKFGPLGCLSQILKLGKREDLLPHADKILSAMLDAKSKEDKYPLSSKFSTKIISRIGLVFLKPKINRWRYNVGYRSLELNLRQETPPPMDEETPPPKDEETPPPMDEETPPPMDEETPPPMNAGDPSSDSEEDEEDSEEDEEDIPAALESIIDELITSLESNHSITRWSAAKGIGRLVARLHQYNGDDVISSVMDVLDFRNNEGAWSGACLALAELAKWGLLLPSRLEDLVPLLTKALVYEEKRGFTSVGTYVRDSACYVCWALFRAYDSAVIEPYVIDIIKVLLAVACFDREINCRRAAAAAFQEGVGRLDNIPHGIDISSFADYFNVGVRAFAYLEIAPSIAKYPEYTKALMDHLMKHKVNSWDPAVRKLTSQALFKLTQYDPTYASDHCLKSLVSNVDTMDLHSRHGCILAIGELLHALSKIEDYTFDDDILSKVENLVPKLREKFMLVGSSSKPANQACLSFIENCSLAKLPFHGKAVIAEWQQLIDTCLENESAEIRTAASSALTHLCEEYYTEENQKTVDTRDSIIQKYIIMVTSNKQTTRKGYSHALGNLPRIMLRGHLGEICHALAQCSQISQSTTLWAEARGSALRALANICITMRLKTRDPDTSCSDFVIGVIDTLIRGFKDYTIDDRGDIGAWVREAAMLGIMDVLTMTVNEAADLLPTDIVHRAFINIAQQAMERIDRTRGIAVKVFFTLLHKEGKPVPYIPNGAKVREIFTELECSSINVISPQDTFPKFIKLLTLPEYSHNVMQGLIASAGGITESLTKYAWQALSDHLRTQTTETLEKICDIIMVIFNKNKLDDRVVIPLMTFIERALQSSCFNDVLFNPQSPFAVNLLNLGKQEIAKSTNTKKLSVSVSYFCQLGQVGGVVGRRALTQLTIMLCHRFLWLRRITATKMFDALMVYGEDIGYEESMVEAAKKLLCETRWDNPDIVTVKDKRNALCNILGLPKPVPATRA